MSIETRVAQYGNLFGDWHIEKLLGTGSGGKSAVFSLYRDNNNGWREYSALKVISLIQERGTQDDMPDFRKLEYDTAVREQRRQADQEVQLMNQLRGKTNIVDYMDHKFVHWHDDTGFGVDLLIRMEKLTDLRSQLQKGRFFTEKEIIRIGRDLCQALVICHGKNILHRDIKPENIFFNADGDFKLGDFGVSRILDVSSSMASTGIGTPQYLAPEQVSGRYDERVDIYSLGLVLYELSNHNRLPFASSGYVWEAEVQKRMMGTPLPRPAAASDALTQVILRACAHRPEHRYQSAEEFLLALNNLASDAAPRGQSGNYSTIPAGGLYSTVPADTTGKDYSTTPANRDLPRDPQPSGKAAASRKKRKSKKWPLLSLILVLLALGVSAAFFFRNGQEPDSTQKPDRETESVNGIETEETAGLPEPSETAAPVYHEVSVYDIFSDTVPDKQGGVNCCHIPQITVDGNTSLQINTAMYNELYPLIEDQFYSGYSIIGMAYSWGRTDDIVSVVVQTELRNNGIRVYDIYNASLESGTLLSDTEVLNVFGLTREEYLSLVRSRLELYWDSRQDILENIGQEAFDKLVEKTLSDDNISRAHPYINTDGELCFAAWVAAPAGPEGYHYLFNTSGSLMEPVPDCGDDHADEIAALISEVEPVYLIDLNPYSVQGKRWIHLEGGGSLNENASLGYIRDPVRDLFGNSYQNGLHVDGSGLLEFAIIYHLDDDYSSFSGWVVYMDNVSNPNEFKIVDIYCDGVLKESFTMTRTSEPQYFCINVTGVRELKIVYPATKGSNDMAAICDGLLE